MLASSLQMTTYKASQTQHQLVSDPQDDKHNGTGSSICMKFEALEPDLFEQCVQKKKEMRELDGLKRCCISLSLGRDEAGAKTHRHNYQQAAKQHCG